MKIQNRYLFLILSVLFLGVCFYFFFNIVIYLLLAFVLSMVGQPVMKFLLYKLNIGKLRWGSPIAAIITMIIFILLTVSLISLVAPVLIDQAQQLAKMDYSTMMQALNEPIDRFRNFLEGLGIEPKSNFSKDIVVNLFNDWFDPAKISYIFTSIFGWATEFLIGVFSVLFITFFFLQEQGILIKIILALVPSEYEESTRNAIEDTIYLLRRYFSGVLLQMTIITIIVTIGLLIVGIDNAFLIGLIAALLNVIPYLGPLMGGAFALAITLVSNSELPFYEAMFPLLIQVAIVFAIMQLIDNFILQPFIFSNRVMAHPLEIFIVVLVAAKVGLLVGLGSIVGMVLAIPVYTILRVIARTFLSEFKIVQKMTERMKTED